MCLVSQTLSCDSRDVFSSYLALLSPCAAAGCEDRTHAPADRWACMHERLAQHEDSHGYLPGSMTCSHHIPHNYAVHSKTNHSQITRVPSRPQSSMHSVESSLQPTFTFCKLSGDTQFHTALCRCWWGDLPTPWCGPDTGCEPGTDGGGSPGRSGQPSAPSRPPPTTPQPAGPSHSWSSSSAGGRSLEGAAAHPAPAAQLAGEAHKDKRTPRRTKRWRTVHGHRRNCMGHRRRTMTTKFRLDSMRSAEGQRYPQRRFLSTAGRSSMQCSLLLAMPKHR
jgi:hypothetical protein